MCSKRQMHHFLKMVYFEYSFQCMWMYECRLFWQLVYTLAQDFQVKNNVFMQVVNTHTRIHLYICMLCLLLLKCVSDLNASTWSSRICFILRSTHWGGIFNLSNASWHSPLPAASPAPGIPLRIRIVIVSAKVNGGVSATLHKLEPHITDLNWYCCKLIQKLGSWNSGRHNWFALRNIVEYLEIRYQWYFNTPRDDINVDSCTENTRVQGSRIFAQFLMALIVGLQDWWRIRITFSLCAQSKSKW